MIELGVQVEDTEGDDKGDRHEWGEEGAGEVLTG